MKINQKKGIPLNAAFSAVLIVLLLGVLVVIGIVLYTSLQGTATPTVRTVINESVTMSGPTVSQLSNATICGYRGNIAITEVWNASQKVAAGNYTLNTVNGTIVNLTGSSSPLLVSYTSSDGGVVCSSAQNMSTQFLGYILLVGLVGTIVFLGIVIGVLISSFAMGGKQTI